MPKNTKSRKGKSNVVLLDEVTGKEAGTQPKQLGWRKNLTHAENENPDDFDVMDCREDVIDALHYWGHDGGRFHVLGTLGNTIFYDYNTEEDSQRIFHRIGHGGQRMRMAMKVQTLDEHERMVALWDLHCSSLLGSPEEFIKRYYEFRNQERKGDGDANTVT